MRQPDHEYEERSFGDIQRAIDFENSMNDLESQLYYQHLSPKEVAQQVLKATCQFYDADWCGLIQVDLDLNLWTPFWWFNAGATDKTMLLTEEYESAEFLDRWVQTVRKGIPMVVPDAEATKEAYPAEYNLYQRLGIRSVIAVSLEPRPVALLAVRNPKRYIQQTSMLRILAYDERNALKDEMIRVIRGKSSIDRDMIQQLLDENQAAIQAAQDALTAAQNKLEEIEQENKKAENDCSNLFTWASTYQNASFQQRQAILNQFIKEVRVGRDYDIEVILNVPLEEFEEFKSHSLSVRTPSGRKTDLKQAPIRGLGTPNGGIVVFDKTSGEAMNIMPKSSAHVTLRCQDE